MVAVEKIREKPVEPASHIHVEVVKALVDANGDVPKAVDLFEARVRRSRHLRDLLTDSAIRSLCFHAIKLHLRNERKLIWEMPKRSAANERDRVISLAHATMESLLDFRLPLPGNKKLRDATGNEIIAAADFYTTQATDMAAKGRWLRLVGKLVPADGIAVKHITEDDLNRIREEVSRG